LQIGYLRSLEDTPRVRAACVTYMQNWLGFFFPERPDLLKEMQEVAHELGGELQTPRLSWKYSWIEPLFGLGLARRAQILLPRYRWSFVRFCDKMLFRLNRQFPAVPVGR